MENTDLLKTSIGGLVRHGLTTAGGALATSGIIADSDVTALVGAGMTVFGIVWSVIQKRLAERKRAEAAASLPPGAIQLAWPDASS